MLHVGIFPDINYAVIAWNKVIIVSETCKILDPKGSRTNEVAKINREKNGKWVKTLGLSTIL